MAEESITEFVYKHAHEPKEEILKRVLENPRVAAWVRDNPERRRRVEDEVDRAWETRPGAAAAAAAPAPTHGGPTAQAQLAPAPKPAGALPAAHASASKKSNVEVKTGAGPKASGKREAFMCVHCHAAQVYSQWDGDHVVVRCRACGTAYADMLKLIPLREVGPFEFLLGTGTARAARVGLILLAWMGLLMLLVLLR